jgi:superfamily I DNA/RNA helicase
MSLFQRILEFLFRRQDSPASASSQSTAKPELKRKSAPATPPPAPTVLPLTFEIPESNSLQQLQKASTQEFIQEAIAKIRSKPTLDQWKMILEPCASTRVVAGAGSGKSTTLILRLLVFHKVLRIPLEQMRVFSFTRVSVKDFREKLAEKLELWEVEIEGKTISDEYRKELQARAKSVVSTFHSVIMKLCSSVMPEVSNNKLFDFLGNTDSGEEEGAINPLLNANLTDEQSKVLAISHEKAFLNSPRYRQVILEILEDQQKQEWQKVNDKNLRSENEVYFWNLFLSQEREYHGYQRTNFNPNPAFRDSVGSVHVDPFRVAVADRLRELGLRFTPLAPSSIVPPVQGWPEGTIYAAFQIGQIFLHIDREILYEKNKPMFFQQRNRKKFIASYCPSSDRHKVLSYKDFQKQGNKWVLSPNADLLLQQWVGLQDLAANANSAPIIRIQIPGDNQKRLIAEVLYQEGNFVESMGLEVKDLLSLDHADRITKQVDELLRIYWQFFEQVLKERQLFRFHDILVRLRSLKFLEGITSRTGFLSNLFIDEFQDISPEIVDWLRKILQTQAENISITSIGDDFQAIYGWRGASPTFLMNYHSCFPARKIGEVTLPDNFRSRQSIIDAAEVVLEKITQKIDKHGVSHIADLDHKLPYPILMIKSLKWKDPMAVTSESLGDEEDDIWNTFCEHTLSILRAINEGEHTERLFRNRTELQILVLSRTNVGLENIPNRQNLRAAMHKHLENAGIRTFSEISIQSLTFHRSKGLEADFVLLLQDTLPPEEHPFRNFVYEQIGLPDTYTKMQEEEARRLAYVAITRARFGCMWTANTVSADNDFTVNPLGCFTSVEAHVRSRNNNNPDLQIGKQ